MLRFISITLSFVFLMCMLAGIGILWVFWTYGKDLPDYQQLANYEPPVVTRIHAGNGALLAEYASEKRLFVPVEAIPPRLIHAFISAED
ncbi:penicillin-binding protein, partial [Alphaproteobacteria bacterium]|nr:penicillin-binding protein [Alphaproteobacteria bacterium]